MDARAPAWLGLGVAAAATACEPDYVHVIAESSSGELVGAPWTVEVRAFGDGRSTGRDYRSVFRGSGPGGSGPLFFTDFNLLLDDAPAQIDLRVAVRETATTWAGDQTVIPPGDGRDLHMLLYAGEARLDAARTNDRDLVSLARFSSGLAIAWPGLNGAALRIQRVPDEAGGRAVNLDTTDTGAHQLRMASRPTTNVFGPDLFAITWIGGDQVGRLFLQYEDDPVRRPVTRLLPADDLWVAIAPEGSPFAIATAGVDGDALELARYDADGAPLGADPLAVAGGLGRVRGLVAVDGGALIIAVEDRSGATSLIRRAGADDVSRRVGRVAAIALSADLRLLVTAQRDEHDLFIQAYDAATLGPAGDRQRIVATSLLAAAPFDAVSLASCAVAWPQIRDDGAAEASVDLRVQDLGAGGAPERGERLAHAGIAGNHFAPTLACMSSAQPFATFLVADGTADLGDIQLRKVPSAPNAPSGSPRQEPP